MWHYSNTDVSIAIDYVVDEEFVVPTSATYVLRDSMGVVLTTGSLPALTTRETITVVAADNTIATDFETRFLVVTFIHEGQTYQKSTAYMLTDFLPLTCTPDTVRSELGVDASELQDREIDLVGAYYALVANRGTNFSDALYAGGRQMMAANTAVALQAALQFIESFPLRAMASSKSEDSELKRFLNIDFADLANRLRDKLFAALEIAENASVLEINIFDLSSPTDVITG